MSTISLAAAPSFSVRPLNTNMSFREQAYAVLKQAIANADLLLVSVRRRTPRKSGWTSASCRPRWE